MNVKNELQKLNHRTGTKLDLSNHYTPEEIEEFEHIKEMGSRGSWIFGNSQCSKCGNMIIVTQSDEYDYFYYCSNKQCENHEGKELYDDDPFPKFAAYFKSNRKK